MVVSMSQPTTALTAVVPSSSPITMSPTTSNKESSESKPGATLHGDLLESILSRLPTADLIPASFVSTTWNHAVHSSLLLSPRRRPWIVLVRYNRRVLSAVTTYAFDPHSRSWHLLPPPPSPPPIPLSSTTSSLVFNVTAANLAFSSDPFHRNWVRSPPPSVSRRDPVVAVVGDHLVVAGGVCEFEDDPCAVEVLALGGESWRRCESMPEEFRCSTSAMWLSVAVANGRVCVVEKSSGLFCSFDPVEGKWSEITQISPSPDFYLFAVAGGGCRDLIVAGLAWEHTDVVGIWIWKLNSESLEKVEIAVMPPDMVGRMVKNGDGSSISSMEISTAAAAEEEEGFLYIYNSSDPQEIFFCHASDSGFQWGSVRTPIVGDRRPLDSLLFTCSPVDFRTLEMVLMPAGVSRR